MLFKVRAYDRLIAGDIDGALAWYESKRKGLMENPVQLHAWARLLCELDRAEETVEMIDRLIDHEEYAMFAAGQRLMMEMRGGLSSDDALARISLGAMEPHREAIAIGAREFPLFERAAPHRNIAICGTAYCGSTLMDRLLSGMQGVSGIGESHWLTRAYRNRQVMPLDFSQPYDKGNPYCGKCGAECEYLTMPFRTALALNPVDWYQKIGHRLGGQVLVSSDKNLPKYVLNDARLRMTGLIIFKSPKQAWSSMYVKMAKGLPDEHYVEAMKKYLANWTTQYGDMLKNFRPQDGKVVLDFEAFTRAPAPELERLCQRLGVAYDASVLEQALPGHSIGGNGPAMKRIKDNGFNPDIRPAGPPAIPQDHADWIDAQDDVNELHAALVAASLKGRIMTATADTSERAPEVTTAGAAPVSRTAADLGIPTAFAIETVHEDRIPGVFRPFRENALMAAEAIAPDAAAGLQRRRKFFEYLAETYSDEGFAKIQADHLVEGEVGKTSNELKYLDTPFWSASKLVYAEQLGLDKSKGKRILDIGTGPAHFQLVAKYFGHDSLGIDLPLEPRTSRAERHMYYDLCDYFGVKKIDHRVMAREPLPAMGEKFDVVVSLMSFFAMGPRNTAWSIDDWRYFIEDLRRNVMTEDGQLYMTLTSVGSTPETWDWLAERATESRETGRMLHFKDMSAFD